MRSVWIATLEHSPALPDIIVVLRKIQVGESTFAFRVPRPFQLSINDCVRAQLHVERWDG